MNEIIQETITYLIITGTTLYTIYKTVLFFVPSQNSNSCSGCIGGSCGIKNNTSSFKNPLLKNTHHLQILK